MNCHPAGCRAQIAGSTAAVAHPVVERFRFVWVWPGDPALADPALVPDLHWNDDPEWEGDGKTMFAKCDYRLFVDNLMDLTHESFVHATSIGSNHVAETPMTTTHSGRTVTSTRWMQDIDAPLFWRTQLGKPGNVDRWQIIRFEAPCTIVLDVGVAPVGTGALQGDRSKGVNGRVLNTITPETDTTSMYFWPRSRARCRNTSPRTIWWPGAGIAAPAASRRPGSQAWPGRAAGQAWIDSGAECP